MLLPNSTPHSSTVPTLANDRTTAVVASGRRVRPFWTALPRGARAFRTADSTVARSAAGTSGGAVHRGVSAQLGLDRAQVLNARAGGRCSKQGGQTRSEKGAVHAHAQRVVLGGREDERGLGRELRRVEVRVVPSHRTDHPHEPDAVLELCERAVVLIAAVVVRQAQDRSVRVDLVVLD